MSYHSKAVHTRTHTLADLGFDLPIFTKLYELYILLDQRIVSFPKAKRYTLGQKLDTLVLDVFELLFAFPNSDQKVKTLSYMSGKLDLLKILLRCAKDTGCIQFKHYVELQAILQELGKMTGGWLRSIKNS